MSNTQRPEKQTRRSKNHFMSTIASSSPTKVTWEGSGNTQDDQDSKSKIRITKTTKSNKPEVHEYMSIGATCASDKDKIQITEIIHDHGKKLRIIPDENGRENLVNPVNTHLTDRYISDNDIREPRRLQQGRNPSDTNHLGGGDQAVQGQLHRGV